MGILSTLGALTSAQDCFLCGGHSRAPLCQPCDADLPRLPAAQCPTCALPSTGGRVCGACLSDPPAFDATLCSLVYDWPTTRLIQAFKYQRALGLTRTLALAPPAPAHSPDLVIPLPLSRQRLAARGYNQALEIARVLARRHRLTLDATAVARVRDTLPQAGLPWNERARNIRGAFAATRRFDGLAVAVVDDVMTTGATLDEMARTLKAAGAVRVTNWVIARALPPHMA